MGYGRIQLVIPYCGSKKLCCTVVRGVIVKTRADILSRSLSRVVDQARSRCMLSSPPR